MIRRDIDPRRIAKMALFCGCSLILTGLLFHHFILSDFLFGVGMITTTIGFISILVIPKAHAESPQIVFEDF